MQKITHWFSTKICLIYVQDLPKFVRPGNFCRSACQPPRIIMQTPLHKKRKILLIMQIWIKKYMQIILHKKCVPAYFESEMKSAESISNNILLPFYVLEVWRVLFYVQSPLHDSVRVERFVCQVLMISVYTDLLTKEYVTKFLQDLTMDDNSLSVVVYQVCAGFNFWL